MLLNFFPSVYILYARVRCANVDYSYYLKFLAENEHFLYRKQGVRFGVFVECGLVNFNVFFTKLNTRN